MIYLDNAATSLQKPACVGRMVQHALQICANPGRGGHSAAMQAQKTVYAAREAAAGLFDTQPEQVVFTLNATHALNLAIFTLVRPGDRVLVSGFEHNAVLRPLHACGAETVIASTALFDPERTLRDFEKALRPNARAVVVNHVSNVFGYIQPLEQIAALCRERNVPLIVDASQSAGVLPISLQGLGAAFIAMPGHKGLYGPQGTGLLLCGALPKPLLYGGTGSQSESPDMPETLPERVEAGTLNVHGIAGLLGGLRFVSRQGSVILQKERRLRERLCRELSALPNVQIFEGNGCQTGVVSFVSETIDCEDFAEALAKRGVAVRAGLHCAPLAHRSAGTLASGTVRVSPSVFTTERELDGFLAACEDILKKRA